jgi:hypothetical protein
MADFPLVWFAHIEQEGRVVAVQPVGDFGGSYLDGRVTVRLFGRNTAELLIIDQFGDRRMKIEP